MTNRSIDPRSGLVFDIRDYGHRAGGSKQIVTEVPAPEGIGNAVIGVPTESPLRLEVRLEGVGDGVLATGVAVVQLRGECARCLTEIEAEAEIDLQELFLFPGVDPDDVEASRVKDERIDLEPVIRDTALLDLPFIPLCSEDCDGLCPSCGANLNLDPEHDHGEAIDPRWVGLTGWNGAQD